MKMQRSSQQGIALLEAMIATVILAIGLLGTIGLQARAYSAMNEASMRAEATIASEKLIGLMSTDVAHIGDYAKTPTGAAGTLLAKWNKETIDTIPSAVTSVTVTPNSNGTNSTAVTVVITWQRRAGDASTANTSTVTSYLSGST
jgi:type IV pilus assembly protein PilV